MTPDVGRVRKLAYSSWVAVCLIWGTTYLAIRICLESMPPFLMGGLRWTIAGGLLAGVLVARRQPLPSRAQWGQFAVLGFLLIGLGNGAVVWAEQWVHSGLTAVLIASSPFLMVGVEAASGGDRPTTRVLLGLAVGVVAILLLVWPELTADADGFGAGVIALQIACLGWALGSSYSRRLSGATNVLTIAAGEMIAGGLILLVVGTAAGEWGALRFTTRTATALTYLTTIGSIGGFAAYTYALKHLPIAFVSLYAYINPIIAVVLGVLVLDEAFNVRMIGAAAGVLAGVALVRAPRRRASDRPAADQSHEKQHDRDHEENVNEVPHRVAADHPQQPEDDEDDRNSLEHGVAPSLAPQSRGSG
jgi:drug/metabolite transporter (DMT)-like permease